MDYASPKSRSILARGPIVRVAVGASILLVAAMTLLLWQRWSTVHEPTSAIIVAGDESTAAAHISVLQLTEDGSATGERIETGLTKAREYSEVIYRPPGRYQVTVTLPPATEPLMQMTLTIDRARGRIIPLPTTLTIIGEPGDRINITDATGTTRVYDLTTSSHYRANISIFAGKYTLTRLHGAAAVSHDEITIEPHTPKTIQLPQIFE